MISDSDTRVVGGSIDEEEEEEGEDVTHPPPRRISCFAYKVIERLQSFLMEMLWFWFDWYFNRKLKTEGAAVFPKVSLVKSNHDKLDFQTTLYYFAGLEVDLAYFKGLHVA